MDIEYVISLKDIITVLVALLGWLAVHRLTINRDIAAYHRQKESALEQERRNLRAKYLVEVYRSLELTAKNNLSKEEDDKFKQAVIDIHFLGTKKQIDLVQEYVTVKISTANPEQFNLKLLPLLDELRKDLHKTFDIEYFDLNKRMVFG